MKKLILYALISTIIIILSVIGYTIIIKKTSSNLVLTISVEKDIFVLGEDIDVTYTIENKGKEADTVINFDEWTLCTNTRISNDKSVSFPYGDEGPMIASESRIKPGEKISTKSKINFFRGSEGAPLLSYFPAGNYTVRGMCEDKRRHKIESRNIEFIINYPEGNNLKAFDDFKFFTDYYNELERKVKRPLFNKEDHIILADKTIEFLYKYPTSPYTGKLLKQSCWNRRSADYKYDESLLNDIEFYIKSNPDSYYNLGLISEIDGYYHHKKSGKEVTIGYLNKLSNDLKSNKIDSIIQFIKSHSDYLK